MKKQPIQPHELISEARRALDAGRFFLAMDLAGQLEHCLQDAEPLDAELIRDALAGIEQEAQRRTDEAVKEMFR